MRACSMPFFRGLLVIAGAPGVNPEDLTEAEAFDACARIAATAKEPLRTFCDVTRYYRRPT